METARWSGGPASTPGQARRARRIATAPHAVQPAFPHAGARPEPTWERRGAPRTTDGTFADSARPGRDPGAPRRDRSPSATPRVPPPAWVRPHARREPGRT